MSTDKTRADRYAATIIQHGLLTFDDCEAVAAELRRLSASEAALLGALEAIAMGVIKPPLMTEQALQMMQWQDVASAAIARTKEARNG